MGHITWDSGGTQEYYAGSLSMEIGTYPLQFDFSVGQLKLLVLVGISHGASIINSFHYLQSLLEREI